MADVASLYSLMYGEFLNAGPLLSQDWWLEESNTWEIGILNTLDGNAGSRPLNKAHFGDDNYA